MRNLNISVDLSVSALHNSPPLLNLCHETPLTNLLFTYVESTVLIAILRSIMRIYLCRVREREDGTPYIERNREASVDGDYIAISHDWGSPDTIQAVEVEGMDEPVQLSPGKIQISRFLISYVVPTYAEMPSSKWTFSVWIKPQTLPYPYPIN